MGRKRKNTKFPPKHQMKMPPCRVCDAPGSGLHYGVNSCEACKGFFHRSFRSKAYYTCDFDNNCIVRFDQKKICTKCRYAKCLACGMSKDAIKTGRYTLAKKARDTLEVRQLDMPVAERDAFEDDMQVTEQTDIDDTFPQEIENINREEGRKDTLSMKSQEFTEIQIPTPVQDGCFSFNSCDNMSSNLQSSWGSNLPSPDSSQNSSTTDASFTNSPSALDQTPRVILTARRSSNQRSSVTVRNADSSQACHPYASPANHPRLCDGSVTDRFSHTASPIPPLVHSDFHPLQESLHSTSMSSQQTFYSVSSSPTFSQHSPSHSVTESTHHFHSQPLETESNGWSYPAQAPNPRISPECHSNVNSSAYQPWPQVQTQVYPDQSCDFYEPTLTPPETERTSSLHSESPSLLLQSPSLPAAETPPAPETNQPPVAEDLSDEMWETLEEIYKDTDALVASLLEAFTLHVHRLPEKNFEELAKQQEKHYESCQLRTKLFGQLPLLLESEYEDFFQKTGLDIDGRRRVVFQKLECLVKSIRSVARFSRSIPGFTLLRFEHMASLIKYARHDVSLLYTQRMVNRDIPVTYVDTLGYVCPLDFDPEIAERFVNPTLTFMMKMWDLELTLEETAVIAAICVTSPDRTNPTDTPLIRWMHSSLVDVLIDLLSRRLKNPLPTFSQVMAILTEFRSMEVNHSTFMAKNFGFSRYARYTCENHPVVRDMLSELLLNVSPN